MNDGGGYTRGRGGGSDAARQGKHIDLHATRFTMRQMRPRRRKQTSHPLVLVAVFLTQQHASFEQLDLMLCVIDIKHHAIDVHTQQQRVNAQ